MRSYECFNGEEKKNLIRIDYRRTNLVRRYTQGRRRCGGIGGGGGVGEGLVFEKRTWFHSFLISISLKVSVVGSRLWTKAAGKPYRTGRGNEEY